MPQSINGWTVPDWSIFDLEGLKNERARHQDAIERHKNNPNASDSIDYWQAVIQSLDEEIAFQELAGSKHKEGK